MPARSRRAPCRHLLLLPPPPSPPSPATLKAAYDAALCHVLHEIRRTYSEARNAAALEIALPCPHLHGKEHVARGALFTRTQRLVAGVYRLICVVAARENIDVESADGVDARILLLDYPRNGRLGHEGRAEGDLQGPVVDIATLAQRGGPWATVYAVESEEGEQVLRNFQALGTHIHCITKIRGGIVQVSDRDTDEQIVDGARSHVSVAVGGTFDHLHIGHKLLLTMTAFAVEPAASAGGSERSITVGITGAELLKNKKYARYVELWDRRQRATANFLHSIIELAPPLDSNSAQSVGEGNNVDHNTRAINVTLSSKLVLQCVEIQDLFGPTITDEGISALIVSEESESGGNAVNEKRHDKGWPVLEVFKVDVLDAQEEQHERETWGERAFQGKLSSTEARRRQYEKAGAREDAVSADTGA